MFPNCVIFISEQNTNFVVDDYIRARKKLKKAEVTSDITSGDEVDVDEKRKRIPSKKLFSSSDEEELSHHSTPPKITGIKNILLKRKLNEPGE